MNQHILIILNMAEFTRWSSRPRSIHVHQAYQALCVYLKIQNANPFLN